MTLHAEEEMNSDILEVFDVENAILTGRIITRHKTNRPPVGRMEIFIERT